MFIAALYGIAPNWKTIQISIGNVLKIVIYLYSSIWFSDKKKQTFYLVNTMNESHGYYTEQKKLD